MNNATGQKGTKRYDISDQGQESSGLVTPSASSTSSWPSPLPLSPVMQRKSQRPLVFPSNSPSPERISGEQYDAAVLVMNFAFNPVVISTPVPAGGEENVPSPIGEVDTGGKKKWKKGEKPVLNGPTGILKICGTAGCTYQTKRGDHMRRHKMNMHSVGLKWHYCKLGDCVYKCKRKEALQRHQVSSHTSKICTTVYM